MKVFPHLILASLAITGCEKSSNVSALQDETTGIASHYAERFGDLGRRVSLIEQRGRSMASLGAVPGMLEVQKLFTGTTKQLRDLTTAAKEAPKEIATAAKSEHPREDLIKLKAELEHRFEQGDIAVTTNLDEIETWLTYVPLRPRAEPTPPPPPVDEPPPTDEPGTKPAEPDDGADKAPAPAGGAAPAPAPAPAPAAGGGANPPPAGGMKPDPGAGSAR